jgi:hypothetical protein
LKIKKSRDSKYKGVTLIKKINKDGGFTPRWSVRTAFTGDLGRFATEEEAHKALLAKIKGRSQFSFRLIGRCICGKH